MEQCIESSVLSAFDGDPLHNPSFYRSVVVALRYIALTRLDIAYDVRKTCQFMAKPIDVHWCAVKCILRYL